MVKVRVTAAAGLRLAPPLTVGLTPEQAFRRAGRIAGAGGKGRFALLREAQFKAGEVIEVEVADLDKLARAAVEPADAKAAKAFAALDGGEVEAAEPAGDEAEGDPGPTLLESAGPAAP